MAQGTLNIINQGFPSFRADLNDQLEALATLSSGPTAPTTTYPFQLWVDTSQSPAVLKQRNAANNAFVDLGSADGLLASSQAYVRSNILGTVSQSGGVPTGAVIERGSNANGEFVRYADGTQICHLNANPASNFTGLLSLSDSQGSIFAANFTNWNYPAEFSAKACTSINTGRTGGVSANRYVWGSMTGGTTASAQCNFMSATSGSVSTSAFQLQLLAIGRWY